MGHRQQAVRRRQEKRFRQEGRLRSIGVRRALDRRPHGARGRIRTDTSLRKSDFKSEASTVPPPGRGAPGISGNRAQRRAFVGGRQPGRRRRDQNKALQSSPGKGEVSREHDVTIPKRTLPLILLALAAAPAYPWGPVEGHMAVAIVAMENLTDDARKHVVKILGNDDLALDQPSTWTSCAPRSSTRARSRSTRGAAVQPGLPRQRAVALCRPPSRHEGL
jgi:hypothetical protein